MAHFQRGSKKSLERKIGLMYGNIGAQDCDPDTVRTLYEGRLIIAEMVKDEDIAETCGEKIYQTMEAEGVPPNMQAIAKHINSLPLPDDFTTKWQVCWGRCEFGDCDTDHVFLANAELDMREAPREDHLYNILYLCDSLFQEGKMTLEEAVWALQKILEDLPLDSEDNDFEHGN